MATWKFRQICQMNGWMDGCFKKKNPNIMDSDGEKKNPQNFHHT